VKLSTEAAGCWR